MADITLENALTALNNSVSENASATDAQLSELFTEIIDDEGVVVDKQPLSRLRDLVFNYILGDGLVELYEKLEMFNPIVFEDANVKNICVTNWGGNFIAGEITPYEAAQVTNFNHKFRNNTAITKFNELRYFTGLTSLQGNSTEQGQFQGCSKLSEVTIPNTTKLANLGWGFRACTSLLNFEVDFTPISRTSIALNAPFREAKVHSVKFPAANYTGTMAYGFRSGSGSTANASIVSLIFDGTANFSSITTFINCFTGQSKLTTITGTIVGIKQSISFAPCPLTVASAIVVLNGLDTVSAARTCTLRTAMKTTYEADDDFITARDAAISRGWSIAYANS